MKKAIIFITLFLISFPFTSISQEIIPAAEQPEQYIPLLKNKKTGLVVNHTSLVGKVHLVDYLIHKNIDIKKIFAPEHGFRGNAAAGEKINDNLDKKTGLPIISLYGDNKKPSPNNLSDIDVIIFDIQDVGCRFYTYISTLHLVMEACAENNKTLIILDRPNPNGDYIAGPILDLKFKSFVGMHPIPIVHGCTVGELAQMINGEKWLRSGRTCKIKIIPVKNYSHKKRYHITTAPSPNLPNDLSIRLYPSLCLFEATSISVGRGTPFPFQILGGPNPKFGKFHFTPIEIKGVAINPINKEKKCYGIDFRKLNPKKVPHFTLKYFMNFYKKFENKNDFLTRERWFNMLMGTDKVLEQIKMGKTEKEITNSWEKELMKYNEMRKKYLLYPDFKR